MAKFVAMRDDYALELEEAERALNKAKAAYGAAKIAFDVADNMIKNVLGPIEDTGTPAMNGLGRFSNVPIQDAVLDIINSSGREGISAQGIKMILLNEGFKPKQERNLAAMIHVSCSRLKARRIIVKARSEENGLSIFRRGIEPE